MSRHHSDRIKDFFGARACDLTPASARHAAHVLCAPISRDPEISRYCTSVLSDSELLRADRFFAEYDKVQFKQRRAFRRFCGATALGSSNPLSQIDFEETEKGRPYLPDLPDVWFSFSSSPVGLLGAWSSTHGIGVDLEDQQRNLEAVQLAHGYFSAAEAVAVNRVSSLVRLRTFFQFWSLKEAALKSIGEGLPFGLDAFQFVLAPSLRVVDAPADHGGPEQFGAHMIDGTDGCAALVIRSLA